LTASNRQSGGKDCCTDSDFAFHFTLPHFFDERLFGGKGLKNVYALFIPQIGEEQSSSDLKKREAQFEHWASIER